jgi:hypothetical protein
MDQYDLQLKTELDLSVLISQYSCHQVCVSCFGPFFTSCEEFFPSSTYTQPNPSVSQAETEPSGGELKRVRSYWLVPDEVIKQHHCWCELLRFSNTA